VLPDGAEAERDRLRLKMKDEMAECARRCEAQIPADHMSEAVNCLDSSCQELISCIQRFDPDYQ
jgi:hypothetical protein